MLYEVITGEVWSRTDRLPLRDRTMITVATPEEAPQQFANLLSGQTDAIKMLFQLS